MYTAKHTFFCESIESGYLSEEESNHAIRVLRLTEGQPISLMDGKGNLAQVIITNANKKKLGFEVAKIDKSTAPKSCIQIAIAPTKSLDRFSFFMEKAIEIGVQRITPILTKNSERKVLNIDKLKRNAVAAMKQSGNRFLPQIDELTPFSKFINEKQVSKQQFIAHCEADTEKRLFKNEINSEKNVLILIGPEGDFTNEEINLAKQNNFIPVSLGESRLRTETAGIVACHTVHVIS